jgi:DNA-binding CsgD family transcriptional regulator
MLTEQMLRRSPALAELVPIAGAHHEKADASGYHKGLGTGACSPGAPILCAADIYVGLTTERADRPALSDKLAAGELRRQVAAGLLEPDIVNAVLAAAGHRVASNERTGRRSHPGGLTGREMDVLRLAARGLTTKAIAERLYISPETVDHHIQHVYQKIGVSTRAAAALWATQHAIVK